MSLTVHGVLGDNLWVERDGEVVLMDSVALAGLRGAVRQRGEVTFSGIRLDESDVDTLIRALADAPELTPCARCRTLPVLHGGEHCIDCAEIVSHQSERTMRLAR